MEFVPYRSTGDFRLLVENTSVRDGKTQIIWINLREIINVYIADGFYKSAMNYENSRVSYAELRQLCHFILFKIKKQNFLDLVEQKAIKRQKSSVAPTAVDNAPLPPNHFYSRQKQKKNAIAAAASSSPKTSALPIQVV